MIPKFINLSGNQRNKQTTHFSSIVPHEVPITTWNPGNLHLRLPLRAERHPRPGVWCEPGGWGGERAGNVHREALGFQPARVEVHKERGTVWLGVKPPTGRSRDSQLLCSLCLQGRRGRKGEARGGIERLRTAAFTAARQRGHNTANPTDIEGMLSMSRRVICQTFTCCKLNQAILPEP